MSVYRNYVGMTTSGTPGTGTITLNAALAAPARTFFTAYGAGTWTVDIEHYNAAGVALGIERNCVYNGGNPGTITRGTPETPGTLLDLASGGSVRVALPADMVNRLERLQRMTTPGGRLTLTSGVPVTTADVTGATTIFYTPSVHDGIVLWDGADWVPITFAETSLALGTLVANRPYDVFGFLSGGALSLELLAWTNDTTRATAVTLQDGRWCRSGDKTRLLLGTFYTTSTTTAEDSATNRYLANLYNQVDRSCGLTVGGGSFGSTTRRDFNANTSSFSNLVLCLPQEVSFVFNSRIGHPSGSNSGAQLWLVAASLSIDVDAYTFIPNQGAATVANGARNGRRYAAAGLHQCKLMQNTVSAVAVTWELGEYQIRALQ